MVILRLLTDIDGMKLHNKIIKTIIKAILDVKVDEDSENASLNDFLLGDVNYSIYFRCCYLIRTF
jgi:hypothetical protein